MMSMSTDSSLVQEDDDVAKERARLANASLMDLLLSDKLIIREMSKYYGSHLAVNQISVGIPQVYIAYIMDLLHPCSLISAFLLLIEKYSKTCLKWPLKKKTKKCFFKTDYCFNAGQKYCRMLSILQYFRPSSSYHLSLRPLFCLFLSGRLRLYCIISEL